MLELLIALATLSAPVQDSEEAAPGRVPLSVDADEARTRITRAVAWLEREQRDDGAWGHAAMDSVQFTGFSVETYYAFQLAANGVAFVALSSVDPTPEVEAMLSRSFEWLTTTRVPKRGSDWDVDCSWSALYGFQAMVAAWQDPRFADEKLRERARTRGLEFYELLERNQEPHGGWGYYEGPAVSRRPTWATSFATACVVPSLVRARELGWPVASEVIERATRYLEQCRQPNGAYSYDLRPVPRLAGETIDDVKGSLGRIQVCNWALRSAGVQRVTDDRLREGLEHFFGQHRFLDAARMRPIPHEAYFANAGYFYFFGHYYAALAINLLPQEEREGWHARLRPQLVKAMRENGSCTDFLNSEYDVLASTAFLALALDAGMEGSQP